MKRITQSESKILDDLIEGGTLLDPTAVAEAKIACADLQITPDGNHLEDRLDVQLGDSFAIRFNVSAQVAIKNVSNRTVYFGKEPVRLELPFYSDFHFLAVEEAQALGDYVLTLSGAHFPFEDVLNHHLQPGQSLRPGRKIEGVLLGEGTAYTPLEYPRREKVPVRVIVTTETDEAYESWLELCVFHCKTKQRRVQSSMPERGTLFSKKDPVPVR